MTRLHPPRVFRFRTFTKGFLFAGMLFVGVMLVLSVMLWLDEAYVLAVLGVAFFAPLGWRVGKEARKAWTFRIEFDGSVLNQSVSGSTTHLRVHDIVAFRELPMSREREAGGYKFAVLGNNGQAIHFSTQILGWITLLEDLHNRLPQIVPAPALLAATREMNVSDMAPEIAAVTAAGRIGGGAEDNAHRWHDYAIGYSLGLAVGIAAAPPFLRTLTGLGLSTSSAFIIAVASLIFVCKLLVRGYMQWVRGQRLARQVPK